MKLHHDDGICRRVPGHVGYRVTHHPPRIIEIMKIFCTQELLRGTSTLEAAHTRGQGQAHIMKEFRSGEDPTIIVDHSANSKQSLMSHILEKHPCNAGGKKKHCY